MGPCHISLDSGVHHCQEEWIFATLDIYNSKTHYSRYVSTGLAITALNCCFPDLPESIKKTVLQWLQFFNPPTIPLNDKKMNEVLSKTHKRLNNAITLKSTDFPFVVGGWVEGGGFDSRQFQGVSVYLTRHCHNVPEDWADPQSATPLVSEHAGSLLPVHHVSI